MRPWSFSSMNQFYTCPRQYDLTRNKNVIPYQETEATLWGSEVHSRLEAYLLGNFLLLEGDFARYKPYADKFLSLEGELSVEREFALTRNLTPTDFEAQDAWVRGIIDVCVVNGKKALVADWKTGKIRPDSDQLKLFAAFVFEHYPKVDVVRTTYVWLAHDQVTMESYYRKQLPEIWQHFMAKSKRLEQAYETGKWIPKPSGLCNGWCGAGREHCEYWSPKR